MDFEFIKLVLKKRKHLQKNNTDKITDIDNKLLKFKPFIQHELGHIKNNDNIKKYIAITLMTFAIFGITSLVKSVPSQPTLFKDIMKVPSAIGKLLLTGVGILLYNKHIEMLADKNIEDDLTNLENMKSFLEKYQVSAQTMKEYPISWLLLDELGNRGHPSPTRRIWAIDKRIERLKRKQEQEK